MSGDEKESGRPDAETRGHDDVVAARHAIASEFTQSGDFISAIVAGLLLGLGADYLFNTPPVFVVIGIVSGFGVGFYKLWQSSAVLEREAERLRGR
jgi:F0F1-type ATP synthase assembly protein I